jgi:hypothetical protein
MRAAPGKPPSARRRFWIAKVSPAITGVGLAVEVVAVERQPRLEPERIAGAEADRLDPLVAGEGIGELLDRGARHRNLEAVLAGVAGPADPERLSKA